MYEYSQECPSIKGYYKRIGETLNKIKKVDFYELPEKSIGSEQYKKERVTLDKYWDSFKYNLDSEGVFTAEEIISRAREIREQIRKVKKLIVEADLKEQEKKYSARLNKRMDLVNYIMELESNNGVDFDNLEEDEEIKVEYENQELTSLHRNQRYWKNIGMFYNNKFDRELNWEKKTDLISLKIKEEEERLQRIDEEPEKEESEDENKIIEEEEGNSQNEEKMGLDKNIQKKMIQEEDEEDDEEIERQNKELEKNIREIEREKRKVEVEVTREN